MTYLATRFSFAFAHLRVLGPSRNSRRRGIAGTAIRRRKVSTTHLLPLTAISGVSVLSAAVSCSRLVGADGSPCSPGRATKFADCFQLFTSF